ncbi:MAG: hypothetical protein Q8S19_10970 [Bacillota bacterium]|nr:hypothetical protein [Bacillota bacterium]
MKKKFVILALVVSFLTQVGCQRPQAIPLRVETAWVESTGEKTILALDRGGDYGLVVDNHGLLVMTFNRAPALKDIEGLFGTNLTYHLVDRELQIVLSPGIERLLLPSALTGPASISLYFYYAIPTGMNLQVVGVELFMAGKQLQSTHAGPSTIVGEGSIELIFSNGLNPEIAAMVTQGRVQSHSPERLSFALKPGVDEITISDRLRDIDGNRNHCRARYRTNKRRPSQESRYARLS